MVFVIHSLLMRSVICSTSTVTILTKRADDYFPQFHIKCCTEELRWLSQEKWMVWTGILSHYIMSRRIKVCPGISITDSRKTKRCRWTSIHQCCLTLDQNQQFSWSSTMVSVWDRLAAKMLFMFSTPLKVCPSLWIIHVLGAFMNRI